jgi:hypothetical protein
MPPASRVTASIELRIVPAFRTVPAPTRISMPLLPESMRALAKLLTVPPLPRNTPWTRGVMVPKLLTVPPWVKWTPFPCGAVSVPSLVKVQAWSVARTAEPLLTVTLGALTVTPGKTRAVVPANVSRFTPALVLDVMFTSSPRAAAASPTSAAADAATPMAVRRGRRAARCRLVMVPSAF